MASFSHYDKFSKDVYAEVCQVNTHDVCAAYKIENGNQCTLTCNTEHTKTSHACRIVNDKFN